jgi:hypothetical protein
MSQLQLIGCFRQTETSLFLFQIRLAENVWQINILWLCWTFKCFVHPLALHM